MAIKTCDQVVEGHINYGAALMMEHRYKDAKNAFADAISSSSSDTCIEALYNLA